MAPNGGEPSGALEKALVKKFGDVAKFKEAFSSEAKGTYLAAAGPGWCLDVARNWRSWSTPNVDTPLLSSRKTPLLGLDVWEHALLSQVSE